MPVSKERRRKSSSPAKVEDLKFHPLSPKRWRDLESLFGERGACGGCWCMWWRLKRSQFEHQKGKENKRALKKIVDSGETPGILAYAKGEPIAWCAVAPREAYVALERSRILKPIDDKPVWSIVCFFVARNFRHKGISVKLLKAVVEYCREQGAKIVEGYPMEPKKDQMPDAFAWTGLAAAFRQAGFKEILRRSPTRPIMRYRL